MESTQQYSKADETRLLQLARQSILHHLETGTPLAVQTALYPKQLQSKRACFVTLMLDQQLRGCVGTLEANQPLVQAVATQACNAAFHDVRFAPLTVAELRHTRLQLSILDTLQPLAISNRADLLSQLRPGIDGLLIEENSHHATFLPAVWQSLPTPEAFFKALLRKANLPEDHWSETLRAFCYTCTCCRET